MPDQHTMRLLLILVLGAWSGCSRQGPTESAAGDGKRPEIVLYFMENGTIDMDHENYHGFYRSESTGAAPADIRFQYELRSQDQKELIVRVEGVSTVAGEMRVRLTVDIKAGREFGLKLKGIAQATIRIGGKRVSLIFAPGSHKVTIEGTLEDVYVDKPRE